MSDDFDPIIYGQPFEPDELEPSIWPELTPDQMHTVHMRGQHLAADSDSELLAYQGRLYTRTGKTVTVWDGRTYPAK